MKIISLKPNSVFFTTKESNFASGISALEANTESRDAQESVYNYLNAVKNYNIPFLGLQSKKPEEKNESIYAIDAYKNFKKFENPAEAQNALNIPMEQILKCAEGNSETAGDFIFAFSENVEETGRRGQKVPDTIIINLSSEILWSILANKKIPLSIDDAIELQKDAAFENKISADKKRQTNKKDAAIYAIDRNKKYIKYDKIQDLLNSLDISKASVYKCLRKEKDNINGIVFCYDFEVETINEEGEIAPSSCLIRKQIKSLKGSTSFITLDLLLLRKQQQNAVVNKPSVQEKNYSICEKISEIPPEDILTVQLRYLQNPFYAVDKEGNYRKFYLQKYVADALGIYKEKIGDCLQKRIKSIKGYSFIYANEVESVDKKGNITLDIDKLTGKKNNNAFYLIDNKGNCKRFETADEAHKALNIPYSNILCCILGRQNKTCGYIFIKANDLEQKDENGEISINKEKLKEAKKALNANAVYLIDKKGKFNKYASRTQAGEALGVSLQEITNAVFKRDKTVHGYIAMNANEIEIILEDGTVTVDNDKINEVLKAANEIRSIDVSKNGFYIIDKDKKYEKFYSIEDASYEYDIKYRRILNCLLGVENSAKGYIFALSEDVESKTKHGLSIPDFEKISQIASFFDNKVIYAISKDGKRERFNSQKEASDSLGIPLVNISRCINKTIKETYGYSFLPAREVEINNDKTNLNEDLLQEKVNYLNRNIVYAIDKDGNYEKYEDRSAAQAGTGVKKALISGCLQGKYKTSHGFIFAHFHEIESRQEDGSYAPDNKKIAKIIKNKRNTA